MKQKTNPGSGNGFPTLKPYFREMGRNKSLTHKDTLEPKKGIDPQEDLSAQEDD